MQRMPRSPVLPRDVPVLTKQSGLTELGPVQRPGHRDALAGGRGDGADARRTLAQAGGVWAHRARGGTGGPAGERADEGDEG